MHSHTLDTLAEPRTRSGWRTGLRNRWVRWGAALAVLWFGVFITLSIWAEPGSPVVFHGERLMASGRLQAVLDGRSEGHNEYGPTAGERFTDKAGRDCRPFTQGAVEGTACQVEGEWRVIETRQR